MPVVSIIVPVYRVEDYLEICVRSILTQTFSNFELLLVDDGSPDRCPQLCDKLAKVDDRIRVFHQENQGQAAARNNALQFAAGEWVCFVDSDDAIHPQMLEYLFKEAQESGAAIVGCGRTETAGVPASFDLLQDLSFDRFIIDERNLEKLYRVDNPAYWCIWGKLIQRDIVTRIPMTPGRFYEDNAVMCQWLHEARTVSLTDARLYYYRINPTGTTKSAFNMKKLDYLWALQEQMRFYRNICYHEMEAVIAGRYLKDARYYYGKVLNELHQEEKAKEIRRDMTRIFLQYEQRVPLSDRELSCVRESLSLSLPQRFVRKIKKTFRCVRD